MPAPDLDWVWVMEGEQGIAGYLMITPCHGTVMVLRAKKVSGAPKSWFLSCLRAAIAECSARGYKAWIMPMTFENENCQQLYRIARRFATTQAKPRVMVMMGGRIPCRQR
ncbi:MAG TPA: hypothetical protein VGT24_01530 [Candidatus Acidoferrales bacterium]|nr:hypothetical protein [Candidatus Acidoferrales bacterium]